MDVKVTLKLDQDIVDKVKRFAKQRNTSLSMLLENYLHTLTSTDETPDQITPLVKSLSGIIELPGDYNYKKECTEYLLNKYK